ncbi:MAG: methyltransferase domain-containing protein [Alphaproteobacteria bacterium]|nr:methyltransferase domain-containing protein [Alphaproteobacteria bacterium]
MMASEDVREISRCEVCGNASLSSALNLGMHPMCDDLVPVGDARRCREYPIEILFCGRCSTAHQRFQIPKRTLFPHNYHYRARHTGDVLSGMRELVEDCEARFGNVKGKKILDIGCNDGSLLSFFAEKGARTYGIEPTDAAEDAKGRGHAIVNDFFCPDIARAFAAEHGVPDIVTFTNVFAHIENLDEVIDALNVFKHDALCIVIENHYMGAVLDRFQFDTFYHEHPRTYSCESFMHIADRLGMKVGYVGFPARYNGNIRTFLTAGANDFADDALREKEKHFGDGLHAMARKIPAWRDRKRAAIETAVKASGCKLKAKAFPGRAAIPVKLLGLDADLLEAAYEKPQSAKVGHYIPGTRVPILSDDALDLAREKGPLLNLAWHIAGEIKPYLRARGYRGDFIDIIASEDAA